MMIVPPAPLVRTAGESERGVQSGIVPDRAPPDPAASTAAESSSVAEPINRPNFDTVTSHP